MLYASGIGTYLQNLVPRIVAAHPEIRFHLLGDISEISSYDWAHFGNVALVDCQAPIYSVAEQLAVVRKIPRETTLFWSPHYNIPLLYRGRLLVTVHDVFHLAMPEYVDGFHRRLYARGMFAALRRKANAILCDSEFTQDELRRLTGRDAQKLYTIHLGLDHSLFQVQRDCNPHLRPYLLFVGNVKPHKNLKTLLNAFKLIENQIPHDLVIVGKKEGFITGDKSVVAEAVSLGDRVKFTGYVEDNLLRQYYVHADALVLPSLYEGFGLPPLEAMACGCPAIVSRATSLPEVCGDAALYCDPRSAKDIAEKIRRLVRDPSLREDLQKRGPEQASRFRWERCAEQTFDVIERMLRAGTHGSKHREDGSL